MARGFLADLTSFASVAPASRQRAPVRPGPLPLGDLEDAMQVAAAQECGAQYIATRNLRNFKSSPIPARTPAELLAELG